MTFVFLTFRYSLHSSLLFLTRFMRSWRSDAVLAMRVVSSAYMRLVSCRPSIEAVSLFPAAAILWAQSFSVQCVRHYASDYAQVTAHHAIGGFHVTSYQADFASHRTFDRYVGFFSVWRGIQKHKKMPQNFLFSSYHDTKLQPSDKNNSTHTHMKF